MAGPLLRRRGLIVASTGLAGSSALGPGWTSAAVSALTPAQTEGPFYPVRLPDDRDADLVRVTGSDAAALGVVTHVQGRVLDRAGQPMGGITVEIWQCDANGRYRHPRDRRAREQDPGFQGYGRAITDAAGGYRFRTIRPVAYPGRTPHIHFKLGIARVELLTTQMYVAGDSATSMTRCSARFPASRIGGCSLSSLLQVSKSRRVR
jgi:protocatechuate 3,4-dioxygenase beta subunit